MSAEKAHIKKTENIICELKKYRLCSEAPV